MLTRPSLTSEDMKIPGFHRKCQVLVGYPSTDLVYAGFANCLLNMVTYFMSRPLDGYTQQSVRPFNFRGSMLSEARTKILQQCVELRYSHLLFVDSDQTFPQDLLHRLIKHDKDVVACNVAVKRLPSQPTARASGGIEGIPLYTDPDSPELERVWRIGTGIMLLKLRVLEAIGPDVFGLKWRPERKGYQGEDWALCEAIQAAGFDLWVDHHTSDHIGHLGTFEFKHSHVGEVEVVPVFEEKLIGER